MHWTVGATYLLKKCHTTNLQTNTTGLKHPSVRPVPQCFWHFGCHQHHAGPIYCTTIFLLSLTTLNLLPTLPVLGAGPLCPPIKINLCPVTQTQHVADVGRMLHAMLACGMQVLICDGHVVHKHGKGLWYGANMVVVRVMGLCAPKCTNLQPPPRCGDNMAT